MDDEAVWSLEERFWKGDEDFYSATLAPECIMAFPAPAGIMTGAQIVESLKGAPRWSSISMEERRTARPAAGLVIIAYRAEAKRAGADPYCACCTSTYGRTTDGWRLLQHQQTPLGG